MSETTLSRLGRIMVKSTSGEKDENFAFGLSADAIADRLISLAARIRTKRVIVTGISKHDLAEPDDFATSTVVVTYATLESGT